MDPLWLAVPGCAIWFTILLLPWRPWSTEPSFDARAPAATPDLHDVTVLIPARNERDGIERTLRSLSIQGRNLGVLLVDDQSTDGTADAARGCGMTGLTILPGDPLPPGWTGKLWAQEQGLRRVESRLVLLLDADIELVPGTIAALREHLDNGNAGLVSLMARLSMVSPWERALMPAFVFFFRLLYPFRLSNSPSTLVAAAAGGCILIRTGILRQMGGLGALKGELIDDCSLARAVKSLGHRTWIGLTRSAISHRRYLELADVREMVARTAFTQLRHSSLLLLLCTVIMLAAFVLPFMALVEAGGPRILGAATLVLMTMSYLPTLRYYDVPMIWALTLPLAGVLYLLMTWTSAWRHWIGAGAQWKERSYSNKAAG